MDPISLLLLGGTLGAVAGAAATRTFGAKRETSARALPLPTAPRSSADDRLGRMVAILRAIPDTLLVVDEDDRVLELKLGRRHGRGTALPRLADVTLGGLFPPDVADALRAARASCVEGDQVVGLEVDLDFAGERRPYEARVARLDDRRVVILLRDVTEARVTERLLVRAKEHAQEMLVARGEFMARMGHDIRNAMTGVLGMTDLLLTTKADPSARRYLEIIQRSGEHLVGLVRDLADYGRLEQGRMPIQTSPADVRRLVADALDFHAPAATRADTELLAVFDRALPRELSLDSLRVRQMLDNLIGNAIKFTEHGEIVVRVKHVSGKLVLRIEDTGVGIPAESLPHVFDAFVQAAGQSQKKYGGSGLGLSITKLLVTCMGGTIEVESRVGVGTAFQLIVPAPEVQAAEEDPFPRYRGRARIATGHADVAENLALELEAFGLETTRGDTLSVPSPRPDDASGGLLFVDAPASLETTDASTEVGVDDTTRIRLVRMGSTRAEGRPGEFELEKPVRRERVAACLAAIAAAGRLVAITPDTQRR